MELPADWSPHTCRFCLKLVLPPFEPRYKNLATQDKEQRRLHAELLSYIGTDSEFINSSLAAIWKVFKIDENDWRDALNLKCCLFKRLQELKDRHKDYCQYRDCQTVFRQTGSSFVGIGTDGYHSMATVTVFGIPSSIHNDLSHDCFSPSIAFEIVTRDSIAVNAIQPDQSGRTTNLEPIASRSTLKRFAIIKRSEAVVRERFFSLARSWQQECCSSHKLCARPDPTYMPTRLIRIQHHDDLYHLTLSTSSPTGTTQPYVALSYCWGPKEQKTILTRDVLASFASSIEFDNLETTIQDAIITTHGLGLDLLWIDALCIIQDSDEDKAIEIDDMASVYSNATLTIIASRSACAQEGFLHDTQPYTLEDHAMMFHANLNCEDGHLRPVALVPKPAVQPSYTSMRAWTFQESTLSSRVLDFSHSEISWRCKEAEASDRMPVLRAPAAHNLHREDLLVLTRKPRGDDLQERVMSAWDLVVYEVSGRQLRYRSDILNTVAGIAKRFAEFTQDRYVAGLWLSNLPCCLLWRRDNLRSPLVTGVSSRMEPSWSWAAVNYQVSTHYHQSEEQIYAKLVTAEVTPVVKTSRYGAVRCGRIELHGYMLPLAQCHSPGRPCYFNLPGGAPSIELERFKLVWDDGAQPQDPSTVSLLLIYSLADDIGDKFQVEGLIIQGSSNDQKAVCRRLGVFIVLEPWDPDVSDVSRVVAAFQQQTAQHVVIM